ncbi:hypothetical protein C2G38_2085566, partial [Gigaspora rosea]
LASSLLLIFARRCFVHFGIFFIFNSGVLCHLEYVVGVFSWCFIYFGTTLSLIQRFSGSCPILFVVGIRC